MPLEALILRMLSSLSGLLGFALSGEEAHADVRCVRGGGGGGGGWLL